LKPVPDEGQYVQRNHLEGLREADFGLGYALLKYWEPFFIPEGYTPNKVK